MRFAAAFLALLLLFPMTGWMILPIVSPPRVGMTDAARCALACARMGMVCPMMRHHGQECSCALSHRPNQPAISRAQAIAPDFSRSQAISYRVERKSSRAGTFPLAGFPGVIDHPPPVIL